MSGLFNNNVNALSAVLPTGFTYVGLVGAGTFWLNVYQIFAVSKARKAAGIKYPQHMADEATAQKDPKAYRFNCAQRAHGNTLETVPTFLFGLVWTGLFAPRLSASLGAIWLVGRFLYTMGYTTGTPSARNSSGGIIHNIGYLGLAISSTYYAIQALSQSF